MSQFTKGAIAWTACKVIGTAGGLWAASTVWAWHQSRRISADSPHQGESVLVLGCPPSTRFNRRLDAAYKLISEGFATQVVISGRGEAKYGRDYLIARGIAANMLKIEPRATNTLQNIQFSQPLLLSNNPWLVSCRWHLPRAILLARRCGMAPLAYPVEESLPSRKLLRFYLREGLSIIHNA